MSDGLDFLVGSESDGGAATAVAERPTGVVGANGKLPPTGNAARLMQQRAEAPAKAVDASGDEAARDVLSEIADFLVPTNEETPPRDERGRFAKPDGKATTDDDAGDEVVDGEEETNKPTARKPVRHDPRLLYAASAIGIGPDEAERYPSDRALYAEIRLRQAERAGDGNREKSEKSNVRDGKETEQKEDLQPPTFEFDEEIDPKLKGAVEGLKTYAQKVKEKNDRVEQQLAEVREELQALRAEHEHAATRETRQTEAKIARMFDEKVAAWGEDYAEILGVPTDSYKQPGSKQQKEVKRLREYVLQRKLGYEQFSGQSAEMEDVAGWIEEARFALWPDAAERVARTRVATGLRKQRGGVGLRPVRSSRETEPPVQGDEAAKAAIGDWFASQGLDPWGRPKRRSA